MKNRSILCGMLIATAGLLLGPWALWTTAAHRPETIGREHDEQERARIKHVFVIVLENEGFDTTFGPKSG